MSVPGSNLVQLPRSMKVAHFKIGHGSVEIAVKTNRFAKEVSVFGLWPFVRIAVTSFRAGLREQADGVHLWRRP